MDGGGGGVGVIAVKRLLVVARLLASSKRGC